ncbi:DUF554 domain-containing protein [Roseofilum capinflatum]|uniref:DUF554 domain-containing protein n=1 Tax=Roseofilum capinflatum BLCC-M114 TaxID=3022440 RepID=A0ABT7B8X9_9CYAN|nr:DUF554 domain-containing protein [Roseofilum capinflatum]MDJ1175634.1 DUF554 domain-containing protein [Roseofilum capinflatum BLCC-M114]
MMFDFWVKTSGTWINVATVLVGTGLGLLLKNQLPQRIQSTITQGMGLITLYLGMSMAGSLTQAQAGTVDGVVLAVISLTLGGLLGEWWQLEERLNAVGSQLKSWFRGGGRFTEGFVTASLLFCVGPLTLVGSLNNGLTGDDSLLALKATMDGLVSIALTGSYGIGVGFSILTIIVFQGGISLLASSLTQILPNPANDPRIFLVTGVGGIIMLGLGLNLLDMGKLRIASFLPALALAPLIYAIAQVIQNIITY